MARSGYTGYIQRLDAEGAAIFVPSVDAGQLARQSSTECTVWFDDGRSLSSAQRNKIFALVRDITEWVSGFDQKKLAYNETLRMLQLNYLLAVTPENVRYQLTQHYCTLQDIDLFSLSANGPGGIDMTTARDFIDWLVELCIENGVPCQDTLLNRCEDIGRYLYACLANKRCCICGKKAELHHVDAVGSGRNRREICHLGCRVLPLCRIHHNEAHASGKVSFAEKYHLDPVRLDEYLCNLYRLKKEEQNVQI